MEIIIIAPCLVGHQLDHFSLPDLRLCFDFPWASKKGDEKQIKAWCSKFAYDQPLLFTRPHYHHEKGYDQGLSEDLVFHEVPLKVFLLPQPSVAESRRAR